MTTIAAVGNSSPAPLDEELVLLEMLKSLLETAMRALGGGEAGALLEVSQQIRSTAEELMTLSMQLGDLPRTEEAQQQRRKLLSELGQQRAFCRAMLRRWRRTLMLRRQMYDLQIEPATYTEPLDGGWC